MSLEELFEGSIAPMMPPRLDGLRRLVAVAIMYTVVFVCLFVLVWMCEREKERPHNSLVNRACIPKVKRVTLFSAQAA